LEADQEDGAALDDLETCDVEETGNGDEAGPEVGSDSGAASEVGDEGRATPEVGGKAEPFGMLHTLGVEPLGMLQTHGAEPLGRLQSQEAEPLGILQSQRGSCRLWSGFTGDAVRWLRPSSGDRKLLRSSRDRDWRAL